MGGIYGDKPSTLARFKENYTTRLSDRVKARLVLENDEVSVPNFHARLWLTRGRYAIMWMILCQSAMSWKYQCKFTHSTK